jgi:hypothetical protein
MNIEFFDEFQRVIPTLPLKKAGNITCANATRIDWEEVCPKEQDDEIYVLGNPTYRGSSKQSDLQKIDMNIVFKDVKNYKNLDYIACWFYLGAKYIRNVNASCAFVTTNSISQGEQVASLWPYVLNNDLEIHFAYQSFKWRNSAKKNAAVIVSIIGLRNISNTPKYLFVNSIKQEVKVINAYLKNALNTYVKKCSRPISKIPIMEYGNKAVYGDPLILSTDEKEKIVLSDKKSERFFKQIIGAKEFINGQIRWVLWIDDKSKDEAVNIDEIEKRVQDVKQLRLNSKDKGANELAKNPHKFRDTKTTQSSSIIIPLTSSERRKYIPIGFLSSDYIISNAASVVYDSPTWVFSLITSRIHMTWVRCVAGRLKKDYRYSSALVYNTFPFPDLNTKQKEDLSQHTYNIIGEREKYPEKTLAELYDPDKMPDGLREAHHQNDLAIERCYRSKPFESDEERLEYLFKLYEKMIAKEETK